MQESRYGLDASRRITHIDRPRRGRERGGEHRRAGTRPRRKDPDLTAPGGPGAPRGEGRMTLTKSERAGLLDEDVRLNKRDAKKMEDVIFEQMRETPPHRRPVMHT